MPGKMFKCAVITPEGAVFQGDADFVAFPAHDGEMGIMAERAPLLCKLGAGELRIQVADNTQRWFIESGFAQMLNNSLTVLTQRAQPMASLNVSEAEELLAQAQALPADDPAAAQRRNQAINTARVRLRLARK